MRDEGCRLGDGTITGEQPYARRIGDHERAQDHGARGDAFWKQRSKSPSPGGREALLRLPKGAGVRN
jgi:hypothetical protein